MEDRIHIGVIPDGNRRYAKKYKISLEESYSKGIDKFVEFCEWLEKTNVDEVSFYALSKENLMRNNLNILFKIFNKKIDEHLEKFNNEGKYFIKFYGRIPKELQEKIKKIENPEKYKIKINILLGYSGRDEIVNAVNKIIESGLRNIDEEKFRKFLWIQRDPDLIIRTGGFQRLSNFLTYQSVYTELYFIKKLWNEIEKEDLFEALEWFKKQKRNFGR